MKVYAILIFTLLLHHSQSIDKEQVQNMVIKVFEDCVMAHNGQAFEKNKKFDSWIKFPFVKEVMKYETDEQKIEEENKYEAHYFNENIGNEQRSIFRVVFIEREVQQVTGQSAAKKAKEQTLVADLTNGIVTSRIKITYGAGGLSLIKTIVKNAIIKFLLKVDQSASALALVQSQVEKAVIEIIKDLQAEVKDRAEISLSDKKYVIGPFGLEDLDEVKKLSETVQKPVISYLNAFKLNPAHSQKKFSLLGFEILVKSKETDHSNIGFEEFLDPLHVVIIDIQGRVSVHLFSNYFQFSQEIAVQSKMAIINAIENMLVKIFMSILPNFIDLDSSNFDSKKSTKDVFTDYAKRFNGWHQEIPLPLSIDVSVIAKRIGDFEIEISWGPDNNGSEFDLTIDILLTRFGKFIDRQSLTLPMHSQYKLDSIMKGFVENILDKYYLVIHSAFNRDASEEEHQSFESWLKTAKTDKKYEFIGVENKSITLKEIQSKDKAKLEEYLFGKGINPFVQLSDELRVQLELASNGPTNESQNVYFILNQGQSEIKTDDLKKGGKWMKATETRIETKTVVKRTTATYTTKTYDDSGKEVVLGVKVVESNEILSTEPRLTKRTYLEYVATDKVE